MANKITYSSTPRATPKHTAHNVSKEAQRLGMKEAGSHHMLNNDNATPARTPGQMSDELRSPPTVGFGRKPD